jgi:hypothetical protein
VVVESDLANAVPPAGKSQPLEAPGSPGALLQALPTRPHLDRCTSASPGVGHSFETAFSVRFATVRAASQEDPQWEPAPGHTSSQQPSGVWSWPAAQQLILVALREGRGLSARALVAEASAWDHVPVSDAVMLVGCSMKAHPLPASAARVGRSTGAGHTPARIVAGARASPGCSSGSRRGCGEQCDSGMPLR